MLLAAFLGVLVFGRSADVAGRKRVHWLVAVIIAGRAGIARRWDRRCRRHSGC
jgi:hypothetical protein